MVLQRRVKKERNFWIIVLDVLLILCLIGFVLMLGSIVLSALGFWV
jgi:uncharacterized membrane protein